MAQLQSRFPLQLDTFENHGSRDGIGLDIDWQKSDEFPSNELDLITDAILEIERSLGGGIGVGAGLWDTDRDTGIQVEEAADEDIIRFDTAGVERMTISTAGLVSIAAAQLAVGATQPTAIQWGALGALVEWTDWVPNLVGGADLSGYDTARYYRLGDICFFVFDAINRNVTTPGQIEITLPFVCANTANFVAAGQVNDGAAWIGLPYINITPNTNFINVSKTVAVGAWGGGEVGVYIYIAGFFEIT